MQGFVLIYDLTGDMDIEQLRAKYAAAFDDDFDMPRDSDEESTDINASEDESEEEEEFEGNLNSRTISLWNFLLLDVLFMYNSFLLTENDWL